MNNSSQLNITVSNEKGKDYSVVEFRGEFDSYNIKEKKKSLLDIVNTFNRRYLVFDFRNLDFINSEGISLLLQINEILSNTDKKLVLINAKKNVIDVLKVIGLLESVPYYKTMDDFLKSLINIRG